MKLTLPGKLLNCFFLKRHSPFQALLLLDYKVYVHQCSCNNVEFAGEHQRLLCAHFGIEQSDGF